MSTLIMSIINYVFRVINHKNDYNLLITSRQFSLYLFAANYLNISLIYSAITMFLHENYSLPASPWKYHNAS